MPGLLADVNLQGHLPYLKRLMQAQGLMKILTQLDISFAIFPDLGLDPGTDDRTLWRFCQENGWVLFTDNRNHEDENSLSATLQDSWREGRLPMLTLANKARFENNAAYAMRVARDVAELLTVAFVDEIRNQPRIFVPL